MFDLIGLFISLSLMVCVIWKNFLFCLLLFVSYLFLFLFFLFFCYEATKVTEGNLFTFRHVLVNYEFRWRHFCFSFSPKYILLFSNLSFLISIFSQNWSFISFIFLSHFFLKLPFFQQLMLQYFLKTNPSSQCYSYSYLIFQ